MKLGARDNWTLFCCIEPLLLKGPKIRGKGGKEYDGGYNVFSITLFFSLSRLRNTLFMIATQLLHWLWEKKELKGLKRLEGMELDQEPGFFSHPATVSIYGFFFF